MCSRRSVAPAPCGRRGLLIPSGELNPPLKTHSMNQSDPNPAVLGALLAGLLGIGLLVGFAINALICWLITSALKRVPEEHRKISTGQVWLLMIPCFPFIWNFIVFQRVPDSFKSHFDSLGQTDVGDCGRKLGLWYSITSVVCLVPLLAVLGGEL